MIDKLKQQAMRRAMKLASDPRVTKVMADPRFMNAIMKGLQLRGRIQSEIDARLRAIASALNLATKEDIEGLNRNLRQVETRCGDLEQRGAEPSDRAASGA